MEARNKKSAGSIPVAIVILLPKRHESGLCLQQMNAEGRILAHTLLKEGEEERKVAGNQPYLHSNHFL